MAMYFDPEEGEYQWRSVYELEQEYYYDDYDYGYYDREEFEDEFEPLPRPIARPDSPIDLNICLWRGSPSVSHVSRKDIASLQELCSRVVGQTLPFEQVLQHQPRVPEDLQKRIIFWSFPLDEKQVLEYGEMMGTDIEAVQDEGCQVSEMLQTGK